MMMIIGEGRDDSGPELVGLGMGQFECCHFFKVVVEQPGVVDKALQDQRLPAGEGAALAAHDRAVGELGARGLVGATTEGLTGGRALPASAGRESAARAGLEAAE